MEGEKERERVRGSTIEKHDDVTLCDDDVTLWMMM
jgi:hypothetical protein